MVLAGSIIGMIGCIGGAGGRYGEQRFLATKNPREAAMLAALWQFLGFPRWVMTGGLCFLAGANFYFNDEKRFYHSIWHLFVLAGSICHYRAVLGHAISATV